MMSTQPSSQPQLWIGRCVGDGDRYRLDQRLGGGGMGEVFVATDVRLGKPVALKLLKESLAIAEDLDLRERFERECSICAALKSPHIVQVTDYGVTSEGYPFYVMEYLQGQTLGQLLNVQPRLPVTRTCNIIIQICDGLRAAHEGVVLNNPEGEGIQIKVVHRDLKPANILLIPSALGELAKIIDFGIAKIRSLQSEHTSATSVFLGTCHYAAPEQYGFAREVDERTDIYSLGMILYEMLSGVDPFGFDFRKQRISNDKWLSAHARNAPIPLRSQPNCQDIPPALEAIVMCCLEKRPANRFASVTELSKALQAISAGAAVKLPPSLADDAETTMLRENTTAKEGSEVLAASIPASIPASAPASIPAAYPIVAAPRPFRRWILMGGGALAALAIAVGVPRLLQSGSLPGSLSEESAATDQSTAQNQFSLNNHEFSLIKTLSDLPTQAQPIWAALPSIDGRTLVSGGEDRDPFNDQFLPIKVWDLNTGEAPNTLNDGHTAPIRSLSLSGDGQLLASGSGDDSIKIWDMTTGKLLQTLNGHTGPVWSVALSQDGKTLVSGSEDKTIKIWDVATGTVRHTLTEHTDVVYAVVLSPDDRTIASGSQDRSVKLWNADTGELIRTLGQPQGHRDTVRSVAFSPDGKLLASGSWEKNVKLWDVQTGRLMRTYEGHRDRVTTVAFINNQTLASGSLDKTIRIWDTQSEASQEIKDAHAGWVLSVAVRPTDQMLVSSGSDGTIKLWHWQDIGTNK